MSIQSVIGLQEEQCHGVLELMGSVNAFLWVGPVQGKGQLHSKGEVRINRIGSCLYSTLLIYLHRANQNPV